MRYFYYICSIIFSQLILFTSVSLQSDISAAEQPKKPEKGSITINDKDLEADLVVSGLDFPTSMAFIDTNDFLILEKNTGFVKRVIDGVVQPNPLLELNVDSKDERGLLGIAVDKKMNNNNNYFNVYLSYVQCEDEDTCQFKITKYELDNFQNLLVNPIDLLSLDSFPDPSHVGGILKIGPDGYIYVTVGDFHGTDNSKIFETQAQNFEDGVQADGRGGILRISPDGFSYDNGIFGTEYPLNLYYAYGIRNSFGIDFDPLTGYLWDTENGPEYGDEINLVYPGFNSGSAKIYGKSNEDFDYQYMSVEEFNYENSASLGLLNGEGIYSDPKLSWDDTVAPTSLIFLDSNSLGPDYKYHMFVGNAKGTIYDFDLNNPREELLLDGPLQDKRIDSEKEEIQNKFAEGFDIITDMEVNPYDGSLYIVSSKRGTEGSVYKIVSNNDNNGKGIFTEDFNGKKDFQGNRDRTEFFEPFQEPNKVFDEQTGTQTNHNDNSNSLDSVFDLWDKT